MPTIKVKLAKTFSMDSHNRAGITVVRGAAQTFEVDDEQYVKICDDPAFDVDTVDGSASDDAETTTTSTEETQTETATDEAASTETASEEGTAAAEQPQTTTQNGNQTDVTSSSDVQPVQTAENASEQETAQNETETTEVKPLTASQLKKSHNRDELVAMATDLGVEVVEADTKATLADKIVAKRGE